MYEEKKAFMQVVRGNGGGGKVRDLYFHKCFAKTLIKSVIGLQIGRYTHEIIGITTCRSFSMLLKEKKIEKLGLICGKTAGEMCSTKIHLFKLRSLKKYLNYFF